MNLVSGWEQIRKVVDLLAQNGFSDHNLVLPLHSLMPTAEQGAIFNRPPPGVRKVIVSTAIAETSITIDDVVFVIDCGKTKEANYDVKKNVKTLQPEWVSLASAKQRRGRAGRVQKGYCFHLYMQARENFLLKYQVSFSIGQADNFDVCRCVCVCVCVCGLYLAPKNVLLARAIDIKGSSAKTSRFGVVLLVRDVVAQHATNEWAPCSGPGFVSMSAKSSREASAGLRMGPVDVHFVVRSRSVQNSGWGPLVAT